MSQARVEYLCSGELRSLFSRIAPVLPHVLPQRIQERISNRHLEQFRFFWRFVF